MFFLFWLQRLYQLDARKFIIGNVGPIGCIPYQKTINQLSEDQCVELPNKLALQYNARLKDLLAQLNDNLPGATFIHANVYDLVMELLTNYKQYGNIHTYIQVYVYIHIINGGNVLYNV